MIKFGTKLNLCGSGRRYKKKSQTKHDMTYNNLSSPLADIVFFKIFLLEFLSRF